MALQFDSDDVHALIDDSDDPRFLDDFIAGHNWSDILLSVHFTTARDWEPEETDGDVEIRTTPDPTVGVMEREDGGHVVFLYVKGPDIVYRAFTMHGGLHGFLEDMVEAIEDDYDGIETYRPVQKTDGYDDHMLTIEGAVERVTPP